MDQNLSPHNWKIPQKGNLLIVSLSILFCMACGNFSFATKNEANTSQNTENSQIANTTEGQSNSEQLKPTPEPTLEKNLFSFAEGTIIIEPVYEGQSAPAFGPIALIDSTQSINWVGDDPAQKGFVFVLEMPEKNTVKSIVFDNDTSGFGGEDAGVKDFAVEISDVSATTGFQEVLSGSLKKGENDQRFEIAKPIAGKWVKTTFKNTHGSKDRISVAEMRGYGESAESTLSTNLTGTYSVDNGTYHIKQDGTQLTGCYEPKDAYTKLAVFTGGVEGNVAKIYRTQTDSDGKTENDSLLMVFARDGKRFFPAQMSISGVSEYAEIKRTSNETGTCKGLGSEKTTAKDQLEEQLKNNGRAVLYGINFDFNSDRIRPESKAVLDQVLNLLKTNADLKLTIEGHTDNVGGDSFNQSLSERRANSVKKYLLKAGINAERLESAGKGMSQPIASNENEIGRAQNRRVELVKQ